MVFIHIGKVSMRNYAPVLLFQTAEAGDMENCTAGIGSVSIEDSVEGDVEWMEKWYHDPHK